MDHEYRLFLVKIYLSLKIIIAINLRNRKGSVNLMKCWIIYNTFLKSDKFIDYAQMIQEAAQYMGHEAIIYKNSDILNLITSPPESLKEKPDYVVFTDKDIYLAQYLEAQGILVYNSSQTIETSDDKIKTYQQLAHAGVPVPETIIIPKTYGNFVHLEDEFFDSAIQQLGMPLIVKEAFGSFGEQVYLANNLSELKELVFHHSDQPLMLQQFISTSYGRDVRIQVVGNQVIAAMERRAQNDFRANVTTGAQMLAYNPSADEINIAVKASQAIGAQFSGVDLLFGPNDTPIVCEVNANAHIRNLLLATGVNAAYEMIRHIEGILKGKKHL